MTHRCALSDAEGEVTIHLHADNTLNTLTQFTEAANVFYQTETLPTESTPCKRLDSFALDKASDLDNAKLLVKIDVQGLETEVIRGGLNTLKKPTLFFWSVHLLTNTKVKNHRSPPSAPC